MQRQLGTESQGNPDAVQIDAMARVIRFSGHVDSWPMDDALSANGTEFLVRTDWSELVDSVPAVTSYRGGGMGRFLNARVLVQRALAHEALKYWRGYSRTSRSKSSTLDLQYKRWPRQSRPVRSNPTALLTMFELSAISITYYV